MIPAGRRRRCSRSPDASDLSSTNCIIVPGRDRNYPVRIINHRLTDPRAECVMSLPIPPCWLRRPFCRLPPRHRHCRRERFTGTRACPGPRVSLHRLQQPILLFSIVKPTTLGIISTTRPTVMDTPIHTTRTPRHTTGTALRWRSALPRLQQVPPPQRVSWRRRVPRAVVASSPSLSCASITPAASARRDRACGNWRPHGRGRRRHSNRRSPCGQLS